MNETKFVPKGSPVEVGLLGFVADQGVAVQDRFLDRENENKWKLVAYIPFSSERRVMTVAYINLEEDAGTVKVVMKGAPEEIVSRCTGSFDSFGNEATIDSADTLKAIEEEVIMF